MIPADFGSGGGPTLGGDPLAVRRVYCVGRNYRDHALEMGADPDREPPFFFTKPPDAVFEPGRAGGIVPFPMRTRSLHHEVELVVAIGRDFEPAGPGGALECVAGYAVGVDLTRRDLQDEAKALRRPWDLAKGFDWSGPVSPFAPSSIVGHPGAGSIVLEVNREERQHGDLAEQIWSVSEVIAHLATYVALRSGDIIFTGTPSGVGALEPGDAVRAAIAGVGELSFTVAPGAHD